MRQSLTCAHTVHAVHTHKAGPFLLRDKSPTLSLHKSELTTVNMTWGAWWQVLMWPPAMKTTLNTDQGGDAPTDPPPSSSYMNHWGIMCRLNSQRIAVVKMKTVCRWATNATASGLTSSLSHFNEPLLKWRLSVLVTLSSFRQKQISVWICAITTSPSCSR